MNSLNLQNLALPTAVVLSTAYVIVNGQVGSAFLLFIGGMTAHGILRGIECAISTHLIKIEAHHQI